LSTGSTEKSGLGENRVEDGGPLLKKLHSAAMSKKKSREKERRGPQKKKSSVAKGQRKNDGEGNEMLDLPCWLEVKTARKGENYRVLRKQKRGSGKYQEGLLTRKKKKTEKEEKKGKKGKNKQFLASFLKNTSKTSFRRI